MKKELSGKATHASKVWAVCGMKDSIGKLPTFIESTLINGVFYE